MPVTIKQNKLYFKNTGTGEYESVDVVSDDTTANRVAQIQNAGDEEIQAIVSQGEITRASIPLDYTTLSDEVGELKSAITSRIIQTKDNAVPYMEPILYNLELGYINTSGSTADVTNVVSSTNLQYAVVPCKAGDLFFIHSVGGNAGRGYAFVDSNGNIKKVAAAAAATNTSIYSKWDGYLVLNNHIVNGAGYISYKIHLEKQSNVDMLQISQVYVDSQNNQVRYRVPCLGLKNLRVAVARMATKPTGIMQFVDYDNANVGSAIDGYAGVNSYEEAFIDVPAGAYYACIYSKDAISDPFYCYGGDIDDDYFNSPNSINYPGGNVILRSGEQATTDPENPYQSNSVYRSTNAIPCKNGKVLYHNPANNSCRIVFLLNDNTLEIRNGKRITIPSNAVAFRATIIQDSNVSGYFDKEKEYFTVVYDSNDDIDLTDYPIFARVKINKSVFKVTTQTGDASTDSESPFEALCAVYVGKGYNHAMYGNKAVLLFNGFGKKLKQDGWASTTDGWETFIEELQNAGYTVVCGGNWRQTTISDYYREELGEYLLPTLGNPFTMQVFNNAHTFAKSFLHLKEGIGVIGCSQGGVLGLTYQYLIGGVTTIVEIAPIVSLSTQGWNGQPQANKNCYQEWYGFTGTSTFEPDKCKGFDPYTRMIEIDGTKYMESVPVKMICSEADTTVGSQYQQEIVNAIKSANGVAEMRLFTTPDHSDISGGDSEVANQECILWLNRFL